MIHPFDPEAWRVVIGLLQSNPLADVETIRPAHGDPAHGMPLILPDPCKLTVGADMAGYGGFAEQLAESAPRAFIYASAVRAQVRKMKV